MDIGSIGSTYLEDYRFTSQLSGMSEYGQNKPGRTFAEILQKAAGAENTESASVASRTARIDKTDKLYEQCLELETFLIKNLISGMRKTIQKSGFIDEGFAGKMYEDMLYDEYARQYAKNAGFGLAEQAYLELSGQRGKAFPL